MRRNWLNMKRDDYIKSEGGNDLIDYHKTTEDEKYEICEEALELSRELYPGKTIYLEVRTWNSRAVKCYEKTGFSIDGEPIKQTTSIGEGVFYRMVAY